MSQKKLLVADDSLTIQKVIKLALSNEGYEIQAASTGNDAIQQILLWKPDLVLIDITLPDKTAFQIKKEIASHPEASQSRFVLMSSAFEEVDEDQVTALAFNGRLTKPFDPGHLRKVLNEAFKQTATNAPAPPKRATSPAAPAPTPTPIYTKERTIEFTPPAPDSDSPFEMDEEVPFMSSLPEEMPPPPGSTNPAMNLAASFAAADLPPPLPEHEPVRTVSFQSETDDLWNDQDSDIKSLTASTVKMSGLDHFEWGIQEKAKKEPTRSMPAPPPVRENTQSNLQRTQLVGEQTLHAFKAKEPVLAPPSNFGDMGRATMQSNEITKEFTRPKMEFSRPSPVELESQSPMTPPASPTVNPSDVRSLVEAEVKRLVQREIQRLIPEITERIVKEEIHRLLSEQP